MNRPQAHPYAHELHRGSMSDLHVEARMLLPIQLQEAGSPTVEAISSYISRVSLEHGVGVVTLYYWIKRILEADAFRREMDLKFLHSVNGTHDYARRFIESLRAATGQSNLAMGSLFHLRSVLSSVRSDATLMYRRWCQLCLAEMAQLGAPPHVQLIWQLRWCQICSVHRTTLSDACHNCHAKQLQVQCATSLSHCGHCGHDLSRNTRDSTLMEKSFEASALWTNRLLEELIMLGTRPAEVVDNAFAQFITGLTDAYGLALLNKTIYGYSQATLRQWARGRFRPSLGTLLDVCTKTGVSPTLIVCTPKVAVSASMRLDIPIDVVHLPYCKRSTIQRVIIWRDRQHERNRAGESLANLPATGYVSAKTFARSLGLPLGTLYSIAPDTLTALRQRNKRISIASQKTRGREARKAVTKACRALRKRGIEINRKNIRKFMRLSGTKISGQRINDAYSKYRRRIAWRTEFPPMPLPGVERKEMCLPPISRHAKGIGEVGPVELANRGKRGREWELR